MPPKHACVLIPISIKGEVGTVKILKIYPALFLLTIPRRYFFCVSLLYCLVFIMQPCGHLLGKGCLLGSPVCDFVTFPYGILGHVWGFIASFSDRRLLPNFLNSITDNSCRSKILIIKHTVYIKISSPTRHIKALFNGH